jgi:hypothetical protein
MPLCPNCRVAAIAVTQSASAVRDLGLPGALSIAAASALGIGYKRGLFNAPTARSAASDAGYPPREGMMRPGFVGAAPATSSGHPRFAAGGWMRRMGHQPVTDGSALQGRQGTA